jgi:hypothetical protein
MLQYSGKLFREVGIFYPFVPIIFLLFLLKHPRLMWKSPPKQGLTLSYARTARELEPDSPFKRPVRRLIRNSLQLGCQTIRRSTTFF